MRALKKIKLLFFCLLLIGFLAVAGLIISIKTIPLNEKVRELNQQISIVRDENRRLYLAIQKKTALAEIEKIATENLKMMAPAEIYYIVVSANEN